MKKLLVALLLLYPVSALAQTYEWTDRSGTVHFTEDLGQVPKKYRKKVKKVGEEDYSAPQPAATSEPAKRPAKGAEAEKRNMLYGGKDEAAWRNAFRSARYEVQHAESDLATLKGRLTDTSQMSRSEYLAIQNTIRNSEVHLQEVKRRAQLLQESADRAGVPQEFRQ